MWRLVPSRLRVGLSVVVSCCWLFDLCLHLHLLSCVWIRFSSYFYLLFFWSDLILSISLNSHRLIWWQHWLLAAYFLFLLASDCFLQHASVDRDGRSAHCQILSGCLAFVTLTVTAKIPGVPRLPGLGCVFPNNYNLHNQSARHSAFARPYISISTFGILDLARGFLSTTALAKAKRWIIFNFFTFQV